jgi:hypothetical protein
MPAFRIMTYSILSGGAVVLLGAWKLGKLIWSALSN